MAARVADGVVWFERAGVEVHVATLAHPRACFAAQAQTFQPEAILVSTDDPAQILLEAALAVLTAVNTGLVSPRDFVRADNAVALTNSLIPCRRAES